MFHGNIELAVTLIFTCNEGSRSANIDSFIQIPHQI